MELDTVTCSDALSWLATLPDASVDMVLTDIPYDEVNHYAAKQGGIRNLDKNKADVLTFDLTAFCLEAMRVSRKFVYIFCGIEQVSVIRQLLATKCMTRHCVWEKTNPSPMNGQYMWLSSIENCIVGRKKYAPFNEYCRSSVWRFPSGDSTLHPTAKPLKMFEYLIRSSTKQGDVVCDPCVGSGTTALAARNTGRHYLACDVDGGYVEIARKRVESPYTLPMFTDAMFERPKKRIEAPRLFA